MNQTLTRPVRIPVRRGSAQFGQSGLASADSDTAVNLQRMADSHLTALGWVLVGSRQASMVYQRSQSTNQAKREADELAA